MISVYLPEWFLRKNKLLRKPNCLDGTIIKETEKAFYFRINSVIAAFRNHSGKIWIPKSIILKIEKND